MTAASSTAIAATASPVAGTSRRRQATWSLLVLSVAFTAGIHAALVPEHLAEMPRLGVGFIIAAAIGAALAGALLVLGPVRWLIVLTGVFLALEIATWIAFVTVSVPGFDGTPEPVEVIAIVCKAIEAFGVLLTVGLARVGADTARTMTPTFAVQPSAAASATVRTAAR
jgi:hypothetical protein